MTNKKGSPPPRAPPTSVSGQDPFRDLDQWAAHDSPPAYHGEAQAYYANVPPTQQSYAQYPPSQNQGQYGYPPQPSYAGPQQPSYYTGPQQQQQQQQYAYPPIPAASHAPRYTSPAAGVPPRSDIKQEHPVAPAPEGDRGFMGALAGGAAGAYAGHKVHHGILGAVGGAFAGHKIQDAMHSHNSKPSAPPIPMDSKPAAPPPYAPPQPQHHALPQAYTGALLGNYSHSSSKIGLDRNFDLIAECRDIGGNGRLSSISLNAVLTNDDGRFRWVNPGQEAGNFGASARSVRLLERGRFLEAELRTVSGAWRWDRICLDERIENSDGNLRKI